MSENKRRFTRIPFNVHIEIIFGGTTYIADKFDNLAIGGCSVPMQTDLQPGTQCSVEISLDGPSSELKINVTGEVVRNLGNSIALKFVDIDVDSLYHLQNVLLYNSDNPDSIEKELENHPGIL